MNLVILLTHISFMSTSVESRLPVENDGAFQAVIQKRGYQDYLTEAMKGATDVVTELRRKNLTDLKATLQLGVVLDGPGCRKRKRGDAHSHPCPSTLDTGPTALNMLVAAATNTENNSLSQSHAPTQAPGLRSAT